MQPERDGEAGFTLLETLVAMAILAAALGAVGSMSSVAQRASRAEIARVELAQVARRRLNEMTTRDFQSLAASGEENGYAWRVQAQPLAPAPARKPAPDSSDDAADEQAGPPAAVFVPYRIDLTVVGPTGARIALTTARLGKAQP